MNNGPKCRARKTEYIETGTGGIEIHVCNKARCNRKGHRHKPPHRCECGFTWWPRRKEIGIDFDWYGNPSQRKIEECGRYMTEQRLNQLRAAAQTLNAIIAEAKT